MSKFINYYEILGIQSTATESEIRKAYHTLAKQYHPDRNHDSKANHTYYDGGLYPALFAPLLLTATPDPIVANRVHDLMQQWIADSKP